MSLVSVVIPVYNAENYIAESIESILNQTFQDFELIIVNDGSIDRTEEIIKSYSNDPRIKYYKYDKNYGYAAAMNKAVLLSAGNYVAIQDADDISLPTRLEEEVGILEMNPEVELVYSQVLNIDREGKVLGQWGGKGRQLPGKEVFYMLYLNGDFVPNPTVMMRKRHIGTIFYDQNLPVCNDFEHLLRLTHDYQIFEINHPLVKLRRGKTHSSMTSCREVNFEAERHILRMIYQEYSQSSPKVSRVHYAMAMSNQLYKEGQFYRSAGQTGRGNALIVQAIMYNPLNQRIYKSLLIRILPETIINLLQHSKMGFSKKPRKSAREDS